MSTLERLSVEHPYYCASENYYTNDGSLRCETMTEFLDDFEDADIDMNLMFRWDIKQRSDYYENADPNTYYAEVFLMLQRKGIFRPVHIATVSEEEAKRFEEYANKHYQHLQELWQPLS